jgi:hypothetical protein
MDSVEGQPGLFRSASSDFGGLVEVRARTEDGREDTDRVEPVNADWMVPGRVADGSDKDSVGAWPEKGILATQLGPNRNGRKW